MTGTEQHIGEPTNSGQPCMASQNLKWDAPFGRTGSTNSLKGWDILKLACAILIRRVNSKNNDITTLLHNCAFHYSVN